MAKHNPTGRPVARWAGVPALCVMIAAAAPMAGAEVVDMSATGFTTRNTATVAAPPAEVYARLVKDVGKWWNPAHTFSGDAKNLSLDRRAGGFFLEKLPGGGSVLHLTVVNAEPGKLLRLVGGMGPLQALGVSGSMTWQFTPEGAGTHVDLVYTVGGYSPGGLEGIAPLQRLRVYVEKP